MKNWKTSLGGILIAVGASLQSSEDTTMKAVGTVLIGVGGLIVGLFGKDNNVTGAGANQKSM